MDSRDQQPEFPRNPTTFCSRISSAVRKIADHSMGSRNESGAGIQYDAETESIAGTLVEPTPSSSRWHFSGRGGAGNFRPYPATDSKSQSSQARSAFVAHHSKPVMRSTGRGGAGNIKLLPPVLAQHRSPTRSGSMVGSLNNATTGYCGRGGAGNICARRPALETASSRPHA
ncbi:hypothetical protein C8R45DRAFT_156156 [Mycena sanguinolenta]|nr:hypothetical protein C8R45DRAFT_156156 [Mycena sanguinolenta]